MVRQNPDAFVVVTGCYAQLESEKVSAIEGVDLVLGSNEKANLIQYLNDAWADGQRGDTLHRHFSVKPKILRPLHQAVVAVIEPAISLKCKMVATTSAPIAPSPLPVVFRVIPLLRR